MKVELGTLLVALVLAAVLCGGVYALIAWAGAREARQCADDGGKIVVSVGRAICVTQDGRVIGK